MSATTRPNILMIVTDQERFDILGCNGSQICETPRLDELAAGGVRFDHAFTPTALCSPARGSLMTGLFPHTHGVLNNTHDGPAIATELDPALPTWARLLNEHGYRLGYVGKWHLGREMGPGRHHFHDDLAAAYDVAIAESDRPLVQVREAVVGNARMQIGGIDPRPIDEADTHLETNRALGLLERYAGSDEPFLLRVDYEGPHHPYMPPEPFASMYEPRSIPPWKNFVDDDPNKPEAHHRLIRQRGVHGMTWDDWQPIVSLYFGFMSFIDAEIGRLLDALVTHGLDENTIVIHTTDHGDMTGSHGGHFNKGPIMYDELYRVPLIIRDPVNGGRDELCSAMVSTVDVMPTIVDLVGIEPPTGTHGMTLRPLIDAAATPQDSRVSVFGEYHGEEWGLYSQRMVRTANAKFVYSPHGTDEIYDLEQDPHELRNLVADPSAARLARELEAEMLAWMQRTQDPLEGWASRVFSQGVQSWSAQHA